MNIQSLTKSEAIDIARTKEKWTSKELVMMVSTLKSVGLQTDTIKVGDIHAALGHPAVVFKVYQDLAYSVLITSDDTCLSIIKKCNSRFFPNSYLTGTIIVSSKEKALASLFKIYDNNKELRWLKNYLKNIYKHVLK